MAQETFEICLDGDGFRIIPVSEDQVLSVLSIAVLADLVHFDQIRPKAIKIPRLRTVNKAAVLNSDNLKVPVMFFLIVS
jgi:hypothetical protein